ELRIAEQYLPQFGRIAQKSSTVVLPANLSDVGGMIALARSVFKKDSESGGGMDPDTELRINRPPLS
ncbi:MAG: hypothetical protein RL326_379, partial [Pseudomonadota bacterium]